MVKPNGLRILVVEDEAIVRLDLELALADLGHDVVASAVDLPRGLKAASEAEFDLAIFDLDLLGQSSAPIARQLRERQKPTICTSGYAESHVTAIVSGVYLGKPYDLSALGRAIDRAVSAPPAPGLGSQPGPGPTLASPPVSGARAEDTP